MTLPLILSFLATLAAAVMAYGTDPRWVQQPWGLELIMICRRLQWPLIAVSLLLCLGLLGLVISGKRRAWWLIALAPVLTLFVHRFLTAPANRYAVLDEPAFVSAGEAKHVRDEDYVVGVIFNEQPCAYPLAALCGAPVIVQSDRERRMLLVWSAYANAATALEVSRDVKARDVDIVCDPADSLLLYNGRTGEFIVALTGNTPRGERPSGMEGTLDATTMTWKQWRTAHPDSRVLVAPATGPVTPLESRLKTRNAMRPVAIVSAGGRGLAIDLSDLTSSPLNAKVGDVPVAVFRNRVSGEIRAFDRRLEHDLIPQFTLARDARRKEKGVVLVDSDTNTGWNARGVAVDGDKAWRGRKLAAVRVRSSVRLEAAQFWYRDLTLYSTPPAAQSTP